MSGIFNPLVLGCVCSSLMTTSLWAQTRSQVTGSTLTKRTHTAFVRGDVGMQTYESAWADSNATATAYNIRAGGYAGEERLLGFFINSNRSATSFPILEQGIESQYNELHMEGRMGYVSVAGLAGLTDIKYAQSAVQQTRLIGVGYGAAVGVNIPLTKEFILNAHAKTIFPQSTDSFAGDQEAKIGQRNEYEGSMKFNILDPVADFVVGYRYRSLALAINDASYIEKQSSPFVGLEMGVFF